MTASTTDHAISVHELSELAAGQLGARSTKRLQRHVAGCDECADWLATYELLASTLEPEAHPSSQEIAEYAIAARNLPLSARAAIAAHVEACAECRHEITLTREAASEARRPARQPGAMPQSWTVAALSPRRLALAASVVLLLATGAALVYRGLPDGTPGEPIPGQLVGNRVLEADQELLVADTRIASGAAITIRAGKAVAFGEGFSIGEGASLAVVIEETPSTKPDLSIE